jgi:hypothetical protein
MDICICYAGRGKYQVDEYTYYEVRENIRYMDIYTMQARGKYQVDGYIWYAGRGIFQVDGYTVYAMQTGGNVR